MNCDNNGKCNNNGNNSGCENKLLYVIIVIIILTILFMIWKKIRTPKIMPSLGYI